MLTILNYQVTEELHESSNYILYRGHRSTDNHSVVLKMLKQTYSPPEKIARFKREYETIKNLNLTGVVNAYSLENYQNRWVMVLEDFGGESLERLMQRQRFTVVEFLPLAIEVVDILAQVHRQHVMHKDINPSNIILNPTTGQLKLIDFGISTVLSQENQTLRNPNRLEGTLAYISPEQTGRMNRGMDYRTDFYSLGVTFYELLTGQLPFPTTDAMELVHSHIAKQPIPPHEFQPKIPQPLSEIVMKLMAKNAEDRYQSAYGLKADLEKCYRQLQSTGCIDPFSLGQRDISDKFQIPQKLYGREEEINTLLAGFERVSRGTHEMMLVAGYSGIGKSALVKEVYKPLARQRGYFISGKFDQFQRDIPYDSLVQAFRALVGQLLTESEAQIAAWLEKLLAVLGDNGQVIIDVIPEVELIIGSQPAVPNLAPTEAQNRFNRLFQNFIRVFAQPEHPLVIFLDDLQWADGASLKLMQLLMTAINRQCLYVIGTYRDNEVNEAHPLMLTLEEIHQAGGVVNQIHLTPLESQHVEQLIADTLHSSLEAVRPLAELVLTKTGGNPFFINEFLKSLYSEELLKFDFTPLTFPLAKVGWQWDLEQIQRQNITDNVVELMAGKMQKLEVATQEALKLAACIGNQYDLQTLAIVREKSPQETAADLWPAIAEGLILPLSDAYKLVEVDVQGLAEAVKVEYKFAHDRIQQAAYSLIPEANKPGVHWKVGQLLLGHTLPEEREQKIFDIVNQLNAGRELIDQQTQRNDLAQLNLIAGKKAKASAAYQPAFKYLHVGLSLLGKESWQHQYDLSLELHVEAAEAAYLNNDFEQTQRLAGVVRGQAKTVLDMVKVYEVQIRAYCNQHQLLEALKIGLEILEMLGITFPKQPSPSDLQQSLERTRVAWAGKDPLELIELPPMTTPDKLAAIKILFELLHPTYESYPAFFVLVALSMVNLSIKYGNTAMSAPGYATYGGMILCGVRPLDIDSGYKFSQLALKLVKRLNAKELKAAVLVFVYCFSRPWKEHISETLKPLVESYQIGIETGDLQYGALGAYVYSFHLYWMGKELQHVEREMAKYSNALSHIKQEHFLTYQNRYWQVVLNLMGRTENCCRLIGEAYNEEAMLPTLLEVNDQYAIGDFYIHKVVLCYLFQNYHKAIENAGIAEKYLDSMLATVAVVGFYFYDSLSQLAIFYKSSESQQQDILEKVVVNQRKMEIWAHHAPMNNLHKFCLVEAERARVLGNNGEAREYYDRAITLAQENEYLNEEALAYELAGKFYLTRGQNRIARLYLQDAHYAYQRWGAIAKVRDLEARYPEFCVSKSSGIIDTTTIPKTTFSSLGEALDLATVMKASQALAGEIVLGKLLEKLMRIAIENAGAQKGFLILETQGNWAIEASGAVDSDQVTTQRSLPINSVDAQNQMPVLCAAIVNYVARTKENVVLNDALKEGQFTRDPYIVTTKPKSILCTPLLNQGKLSGILYLENNLSTGAFTPARLEVLNLLSSQAAISIENANLYNNLEQKVQERTLELEQEIVERKRAEEAAQAANEAKSTFLANMSHELRSPLNTILGFSQLMIRTPNLPPEHIENVGIITRSGEHLLTLINQVLDLSKIEAGRTTLNEKSFDLYHLLDDVEDMFQLKADEKRLQLTCDRAPDVPRYVQTDEVKLRQVLINLLNNALKFTEEGGVLVRVTGESREAGVGNQEESSPHTWPGVSQYAPTLYSLVFEVEDTGAGIAPEELDSIFEAFVQTKTGKQSQEGTGLGLPISRFFVQLMGGEMTVSSQVGRGTTFKFDIRVSVADVASTETKQLTRQVIALEPNQPRYRILIVDDKQDNRLLLTKLLNPLGFELKEASNGVEAVETWDEWEPHLIWMDMRMPVMDGYEATKQIKSTTKGQATAIIALTASLLEEEKAVVLSAGCDDFLRKPFREADIFELMSQHIGVRYIYDKFTIPMASTLSKRDIQNVLTPEALATLPAELLANLEHAANFAYMTEIDGYINEVRIYNTILADVLARLALDFEYGKIVTLLQQIKK